ncbi:COMM domain-containing protein 1-like [Salvelinus fontinalis]|uniref:COMM domain-containing protein 1-like n=1 Tax=Salvelinus fontinalis TaxID=8038 RepID=UPI0024856EBC|nr:COMM domain-containing protein 1-like [Salvelinus fontinalis]
MCVSMVRKTTNERAYAQQESRDMWGCNMADVETSKSLNGLLNGIAQIVYYNNAEITEELLKNELYPDLTEEEFRAMHEKMKGLLKSIATANMDQAQLEAFLTAQTRKQGTGGVSAEQAAALSRFWKSHRARVRESLLGQSRWEPGLKGLTWRVDLQTSASRGGGANIPVALVELELGRTGEDSDFVCLEFDEAKVNQVLKKMAEIQESIDAIVHRS